MAVSPQVFLSYGRPDRAFGHRLGASLWRNEIECYNYMAKPTEDRGVAEMDHKNYILAAKYFIAFISNDYMRDAVIEELEQADWLASQVPGRMTRIYLLIDNTIFKKPVSLVDPDHIFEWNDLEDCDVIAQKIIETMSPAFLERCHEGWKINKGLYSNAWEELGSLYSKPEPPDRAERLG